MKRRKVFTFCYVFSQFSGAHRAHSLYYIQYVQFTIIFSPYFVILLRSAEDGTVAE